MSFNINDIIGFNDGLNHLRFCMNIFNKISNKKNHFRKKIKFDFKFLLKSSFIHLFLNIINILNIKIYGNVVRRVKEFDFKELNKFLNDESEELNNFYNDNLNNILKIINK